MATQSVKMGIPAPPWPTSFTLDPGVSGSTYVLDGTSDKIALIFAATAAKSITKIHIYTGTVTTGTNSMDLRVETVTSGGEPSGTLWNSGTTNNSNVSITFLDTNDFAWVGPFTLTGATGDLAVGDLVAIVLVNNATTANTLQISRRNDEAYTSGFPYGLLQAIGGGAWAKQAVAAPMFLIEYSDGSFEPVLGMHWTGATSGDTSFDNNDATNRIGNRYNLPFVYRSSGVWVSVDGDNDWAVKLYDSGGTEQRTTSTQVTGERQGNTGMGLHFLPWTAGPFTHAKDTNYEVAIVPGTTLPVIIRYITMPTAASMDMLPLGQKCHYVAFTSSAWTPTTTRRAILGLILDGFDDAVGGSSGPVGHSLLATRASTY